MYQEWANMIGASTPWAGTLTTTEPPRPALLDDVRSSLESAITELNDVTQALAKYGDATLGTLPATPDKLSTGNARQEGSRADAIRLRLDHLHRSIGELRQAASRIHAI